MMIATIYTTCANEADARILARRLVQERLAGCANIIPQITSIYEWKGQMEESSEAVIVFKTRSELVAAAIARIRELHVCECPCVTAWASTGGNPDFFHWVFEQTQGSAAFHPPEEAS